MNNVFWLTGLPCSGKTTIAKELARRIDAEILDGDDIREFMKNQDFSEEGRKKHMLAIAEWANRFSKYTNVIVSLVSPLKKVRDEIMNKYSNFKEIWIQCDIEECKRRDVKGMYAKVIAGEIKGFTGMDSPYEEPNVMKKEGERKTTFVDTETFDVQQCVEVILDREYKQKIYSLFIGRYQPLHQGHIKLMRTVLDEGKNILIGLRNTGVNESNPYGTKERIEMIGMQFNKEIEEGKVKILRMPDIENVVYGRKVGWGIRQIKLDEKTEEISATKIREGKDERII